MVINFLHYVENKKIEEAAKVAELQMERLRREYLELVLTDLLAELQAA